VKLDGFISNIEALERWFELANSQPTKRPYFTLYRGYEAKADRVIYRNEEIAEPEKAWELLEEVLTAHSDGGGSFRVYLTDKPGGNTGLSTFVKLPGTTAAPQAGIAGHATGAGMWGIYGNMKEYLDAEIERRQTEYELKRQIEDLQADRDARIGTVDRFLENLIDRPELYQLLQGLGMKAIGALGAGAGTAARPPQQPARTAGHDQAEAADGYDYERIEPALDQLRTVFDDPEDLIEKFARFSAANPDQAHYLKAQLDAQP
jgi:hypothetical protein